MDFCVLVMKQLFEMSVFFKDISDLKKDKSKGPGRFYLALNGDKDIVRPPHFHIYDKNQSRDAFTIEINLQRFLCEGRVIIRRFKDGSDDYAPNNDEQIRYQKIAKRIHNVLLMKPNVSKPDYVASSRDCIEAMIRIFNKEADIVRNGSTSYKNVPEEEKFLTIIRENADKMKILPEFRKYFSAELQKKYADCFQ